MTRILVTAGVLIASLCGPVMAGCVSVPSSLFRAVELPRGLKQPGLSMWGSGKLLALCAQQDQVFRIVTMAGSKTANELFLKPPAGQSFRQPHCSLWNGGEVIAVDDERFFGIYSGASVVFFREKKYRSEAFPAVRDDEVFWSPHVFELLKKKEAGLIRSLRLGDLEEREAWAPVAVDWSAPLPVKEELLGKHEAFAVPTKNALWIVERFTGDIYLLRQGVTRKVFSAAQTKWITKWSESAVAGNEIKAELGHVAEAKEAEAEALLLGDATNPQRKAVHKTFKLREHYYLSGFPRKDELIVSLGVGTPTHGALWFRRGETPICLSFDPLRKSSENWQETAEAWLGALAATDDALWLREPFGYLSIADLEAWLSAAGDLLAGSSEPQH